jgi:hypothetical protein
MDNPSSNTHTGPVPQRLLLIGLAVISLIFPVSVSASVMTVSPDPSLHDPLSTVRIVEHSLEELDRLKNSTNQARQNALIEGLSAAYGSVTAGQVRTFAQTGTSIYRRETGGSAMVRSGGELTDQYFAIPGMGISARLIRAERLGGSSLVADGEFRLESIGSIRHIFAHNNHQGLLALESIGEGDTVMYGETGDMMAYRAVGTARLREDQLGVLERYPPDSLVLSTCDLTDETLRTVIIFRPVSTP